MRRLYDTSAHAPFDVCTQTLFGNSYETAQTKANLCRVHTLGRAKQLHLSCLQLLQQTVRRLRINEIAQSEPIDCIATTLQRAAVRADTVVEERSGNISKSLALIPCLRSVLLSSFLVS